MNTLPFLLRQSRLSCGITVHYENTPSVKFKQRQRLRAQFYAALWISPIRAMHSLTVTNVFFAERYGELFCFSFNPNLDKELREKAWGFIDLKAEFSRMGIPRNLWHVTAANHEYRVSIWSDACSCSGSITMISFSTKFQRSVFEYYSVKKKKT